MGCCGVNAECIYNRLEQAERQGTETGYRLSVDMLFPGDEVNNTETQGEELIPPHSLKIKLSCSG